MTQPSFYEDVINLRIVAFLLENEEPLPTELVERMVCLHWVSASAGDAARYSLTSAGADRLSSNW
jgi:hypothetical protein